MALFGRGRKAQLDDLAAPGLTFDDPAAEQSADDERTSGPYDIADVPEPENSFNFGVLRVPTVPHAKYTVNADQNGRLIGVTVTWGRTAVQINAFAAPRSEGLWDEIRQELIASAAKQGGSAQEKEGEFGTELQAVLPVRMPDGRNALSPARFVGVDGPRWLLRVLVRGDSLVDQAVAKDVDAFIRNIVVDRGSEARPPREVLALTLPHVHTQQEVDAAQAAAQAGGDAAPAGEEADGESSSGGKLDDFDPLTRGPEITEIR